MWKKSFAGDGIVLYNGCNTPDIDSIDYGLIKNDMDKVLVPVEITT